jgi:hypothetical protein
MMVAFIRTRLGCIADLLTNQDPEAAVVRDGVSATSPPAVRSETLPGQAGLP